MHEGRRRETLRGWIRTQAYAVSGDLLTDTSPAGWVAVDRATVVRVLPAGDEVRVQRQIRDGRRWQDGVIAAGRQIHLPIRPADATYELGLQRRDIDLVDLLHGLADPRGGGQVGGLAGDPDMAGGLLM